MMSARNVAPEEAVESGMAYRALWLAALREQIRLACGGGAKPGKESRDARRFLLGPDARLIGQLVGLDGDQVTASMRAIADGGWRLPDRMRGRTA